MRRFALTLRGWWRLHFGFCPLCNSSPPRMDCPICLGSLDYGRFSLPENMKTIWWDRYMHHISGDE